MFSLNVCGLVSKLRSSDLEEICQNYDMHVLCFNETKLDEYDEVQIANFINLPPLIEKVPNAGPEVLLCLLKIIYLKMLKY